LVILRITPRPGAVLTCAELFLPLVREPSAPVPPGTSQGGAT
jgi:hypothetical protein